MIHRPVMGISNFTREASVLKIRLLVYFIFIFICLKKLYTYKYKWVRRYHRNVQNATPTRCTARPATASDSSKRLKSSAQNARGNRGGATNAWRVIYSSIGPNAIGVSSLRATNLEYYFAGFAIRKQFNGGQRSRFSDPVLREKDEIPQTDFKCNLIEAYVV